MSAPPKDDWPRVVMGTAYLVLFWSVAVIVCMTFLSSLAYPQALEQQAATILRTYCFSCHGAEHADGNDQYDVTDLAYLRTAGYAVPGNPEGSKILRRLSNGTMPPAGSPQPSAAEVNVLRQWIAQGAKGVTAPNTESADHYVLRHILADLQANIDGRNFRYFSLTNVPESALPQYHAALSKALNSLTLEANISWPEAIDNDGKVLRIDQRDYGWNDAQWNRLLNHYPYYEAPAYVRADWFIANALKPPIYYDLLFERRADNERELERLLGINTANNIRGARVVRAGLLNSGVAFHNRVIERHPTRFGSYWKSYDFATGEGRQNILRFPLGPRGTGFNAQAFEENGTEIIFSLPNGLHGYYVADAEGRRLNAAPTNIVVDRHKVSGTLDVVPGVSCIACHQQGIQDKFTDSVRFGTRFDGAARNRILSIYADPQRMAAFTAFDKQRYLQAVRAATGAVQEPVGGVALKYQEPLGLEAAAAEAGVSPVAARTAIAVDPRLRAVLLPLVQGGTVQRASWESKEQGQSPAERLADVLRN